MSVIVVLAVFVVIDGAEVAIGVEVTPGISVGTVADVVGVGSSCEAIGIKEMPGCKIRDDGPA